MKTNPDHIVAGLDLRPNEIKNVGIGNPITLKCGLTLPNRLAKAAMAENFANEDKLPTTTQCLASYRHWAQGGWGMVITGNVQIDSKYLGGGGDIAIDDNLPREKTLDAWKTWANACSGNGTKAIVQLNHPGRQCPFTKSIAPSSVPIDFGKGIVPSLVQSIVFGTPREMTLDEIKQVIQQFADAARLAADAGFAGVEIHAAHGYLLTQFLSSRSNLRTDEYGGPALNRVRLTVEVIRAVRAAVPANFCVGLKLNSADHQSEEDMSDMIDQIRAIDEAGVNFLEISGGSLNNPTFNVGKNEKSAGTQVREAYFIDFANVIRERFPKMPLLVTGGWKTRSSMNAAINNDSCDMIGLARSSVLEPLLPRKLLLRKSVPDENAVAYAKRIKVPAAVKLLGVKLVGVGMETSWYTKQIQQMGPKTGSILVTGSNGGLGRAVVNRILADRDLAKSHHGLYTVRSIDNAARVKSALSSAEQIGHTHNLMSLDLSSLASVRKIAQEINSQVAEGIIPPIRSLVLNAGYQEQATQSFTEDGFDMSFQANYLSHFLLTLLLLKSMDRQHGRIVVLSSWTHDTTHPNNKLGGFTDMYGEEPYRQIFSHPSGTESIAKGTWSSAKAHPGDMNAGLRRYGAAKLCQVMMSRELSRRLSHDPLLSNISVVALDPGAMPSELTRRDDWFRRIAIGALILRIVTFFAVLIKPNGAFRTTTKSAKDVVRAATSETNPKTHGLYFNGSEESEPGEEAKDETKAETLWKDSLRYAEVQDGETVLVDWK